MWYLTTKSKGKIAGNAISEFQKLSLSKQGQVQNLCCENELHLHENEKSFSHQWLCTEPRLETEACGNSEMTSSSENLVPLPTCTSFSN